MDGQEVLLNWQPEVGHWQREGITFEGERPCRTVELRAQRQGGAGPQGQPVSQPVQSWDRRTVVDWPMAEWAVNLRLHGRRIRGRNAQYPQQVFTERISQVVAPASRRTQRLAKRQEVMTWLVSRSMSERRGSCRGRAAGKDPLRRLVRQMELAPPAPRACSGWTIGPNAADRAMAPCWSIWKRLRGWTGCPTEKHKPGPTGCVLILAWRSVAETGLERRRKVPRRVRRQPSTWLTAGIG